MATFPIFPASTPVSGALPDRELPDYLPARMVNEFVYCPRLFYLENVQGEFLESADTIEGQHLHRVVDKEGDGLPTPSAIEDETLRTRSIMLTSERLRVIAKLDVVEVRDGLTTPVDTKRGRPRETRTGLELWPSDKVQLALQILVLRENGYRCEEGIVYYATTKQKVRVAATPELIAETERQVADAWALMRRPVAPPPLEDSPKCPGCSLAPICLPDEVNRIGLREAEPDAEQLLLFELEGGQAPRKGAGSEVRRLLAPREERKPLYLNTQGLRVGKSGGVLQVREKESLVQEVRMHEVCQVNLMGNIQMTTQAIQALCEAEIPVSYFSQGGWFYGTTSGLATKNVFLRQAQYRLAEETWFCRRLAGALIAGKIRNQRTQLLRNHEEPPALVLSQMKEMAELADSGPALERLLGVEGNAARLYFGALQGLIKVEGKEAERFQFDFNGRNRRPPRDPINAMLSLAYSMLTKDMTIACAAVGFDPMLGFYHRPRHGRPALALDLMEPFRPLIADSAVMQAINTRMVQEGDFVAAGGSVALRPEGRKAFYRAYEMRMDSLVTHPLFEYRVSYRRLLEIQARLLGKLLQGEIGTYPVFVTR